MATTALTKTLVKDLKMDVSRLLGRGRKAFPCPLNITEQANFWHNMLPPDTVAAYKLLKDRELNVGSLCTFSVKFFTEFDNNVRYAIQFVAGNSEAFIDHPFNAPDPNVLGTERRIHMRTVSNMYAAFPGDHEKWGLFLQWIENMAIIERDFEPAITTLEEVLGFCGTIGQLVRAIPDLVKYLNRGHQDLLRKQSRSSNMPYEWGAFDRGRIENLQVSMAKASLMPSQTSEWGEIYVTGARFA